MRATFHAKACKLMRETGAAPFLAGAGCTVAATFLAALVLKAFALPHA